MEYMGNKEFWDEKFVSRGANPLSPENILVQSIRYFKKGTVLDIACGDGRNALFLIENGFKVTGVDFSSKALQRLNMFAERNSYTVNTIQIDLTIQNALNHMGIFDNILINHYRLSKQQLKEIQSHITEEGILFVSGFGYKHKADSKIRKEDLIQPTDFEDILKFFQLIEYNENQDERGFFVTYIFRKRKDDFNMEINV